MVGIPDGEVKSLPQELQDALGAVQAPVTTTQKAAWNRYNTYVRWAQSEGLDSRSPVSVFAWLATKRQKCLPETLATYRTQIATIMFALGHITADTRSRMGSIRITGRIRDVIDILNDREERALTTDELVRLLTNTSLSTPSRIRLFVALVVHARAGNEGDLQDLAPHRLTPSNTRPGFWVLHLAGLTKPQKGKSPVQAMQRLDHVVMVRFPPPVNDYLSAAANNHHGAKPLALLDVDRQALQRFGRGVHSLKHTAIRLLSEVLDGCPLADTVGLIAGRHVAPTNSRSARGNYTGRDAQERDLWAKRVPQALSLLSDWLATKIGWDPALTPRMRALFERDLGIQRYGSSVR